MAGIIGRVTDHRTVREGSEVDIAFMYPSVKLSSMAGGDGMSASLDARARVRAAFEVGLVDGKYLNEATKVIRPDKSFSVTGDLERKTEVKSRSILNKAAVGTPGRVKYTVLVRSL